MVSEDPWMAAMRRGDLAAAWAISDAVLQRRLVPREVPYLTTRSAGTTRKKDVVRIGVVWTAGNWDQRRNIPVDLLDPLGHMSHIRLFSLQFERPEKLPSIPWIACDCDTVSKTAE